MSIRGSFWDVTDDDWEYQVNVNVRSPYILAQHVARQMMRTRSAVASSYQHDRGPRVPSRCRVYNLAKAGVEAMTRNMSFELGPYGISVNCVAPGNMAIRPGASEQETGLSRRSTRFRWSAGQF